MGTKDFTIVDSTQHSSVADLIEEIQDRIPEDKIENIFPTINRAIRTIAKRLFANRSDLIMGSFSIPIYAEVEYESDTIAVVEGTPATITDSDSEFVDEGFEVDMYVNLDSTTNPGPYRLITVAAGTLTLHRAHSVTSESAGSDITITSSAQYAPLPADFWGLIEKPNISGKQWQLQPSPGRSVEIQYTSGGEPYYYKIKGTDIWIFPETSSDITIVGDYWQKPALVSQMEDFVPFAQLLDDAIQEYLVMALGGGAAVTSESLKTFLDEAVDVVVNSRSHKVATPMPDGISFDSLYGD